VWSIVLGLIIFILIVWLIAAIIGAIFGADIKNKIANFTGGMNLPGTSGTPGGMFNGNYPTRY
jgi:hypothetical protein